jgi:hypothetical protein
MESMRGCRLAATTNVGKVRFAHTCHPVLVPSLHTQPQKGKHKLRIAKNERRLQNDRI